MATLRDTSALEALNEKDYVNKLYDTNTDTTKKLLEQHFTDNTGVLNTEQQKVQQQTQENVNRTQVEAQTAREQYNGPKLTLGAQQQEALSRGNATQKNVTDLQQKQNDVYTEIERQRQLLASQYESAIKQAQADNDMQRAQQLYNAAKDEEAKLLDLKLQASSLLAAKGDTSIQDSLLSGYKPAPNYTGQTWAEVLRNESAINEIYDKQLEAERLGLQMQNEEDMSDLEAKRQQKQAQTDEQLTQAYVDALRKAKNYQEVQTAYGQGSGTAAAARIARDIELQNELTDLRNVQAGADASLGMEGFDIGKAYRKALADKTADINKDRAEALFKAAEEEEDRLYKTQLEIGKQKAQMNDYSILGKLYGLTQDQIDRLQGTGAYAPVLVNYGGGGGYDGGNYSGGSGDTDIIMKAAQDAKKYGAQAAIDAVNSTNASQAVKNAAIQNAQGVAMTEYYKNRVVK